LTEAVAVTLKLFASLGVFLPDSAQRNCLATNVAVGTTIQDLLDRHQVPLASRHLVLLNGVFIPPGARPLTVIKAGDAVAVWPPVAGG